MSLSLNKEKKLPAFQVKNFGFKKLQPEENESEQKKPGFPSIKPFSLNTGNSSFFKKKEETAENENKSNANENKPKASPFSVLSKKSETTSSENSTKPTLNLAQNKDTKPDENKNTLNLNKTVSSQNTNEEKPKTPIVSAPAPLPQKDTNNPEGNTNEEADTVDINGLIKIIERKSFELEQRGKILAERQEYLKARRLALNEKIDEIQSQEPRINRRYDALLNKIQKLRDMIIAIELPTRLNDINKTYETINKQIDEQSGYKGIEQENKSIEAIRAQFRYNMEVYNYNSSNTN